MAPCAGNTDWEGIPHTSPNASPVEMRRVVDVLAIRIRNGHLRGSDIKEGVFELADVAQPFDVFDGKTRVEVKVCWFERKPKTTWAHITLNGEWELLRNYSGNVVDNIA